MVLTKIFSLKITVYAEEPAPRYQLIDQTYSAQPPAKTAEVKPIEQYGDDPDPDVTLRILTDLNTPASEESVLTLCDQFGLPAKDED